jgi:DNA-binding FadR family transcriptional regulator
LPTPNAAISRASGPRPASEDVAEAIRSYVHRENLGPDDRLGREEDLARQFGVSRPTLREALRLLTSTHLVRASKGPGGGIFVAATPEQGIGRTVTASIASMLSNDRIELRELLETRMVIEVPLVGLAAQRADERDMARLEELAEEAARDPHDAARVGRVDRQLHAAIGQIAGNRLAAAFTEWIVEVLQPSLHALIDEAVVPDVLVAQHRDIVRAIGRGDSSAAERAMREHLVYVEDVVNAVGDATPRAAGASVVAEDGDDAGRAGAAADDLQREAGDAEA